MNINISDVKDFEIELVNPEFEQVYIKKFYLKIIIIPKYLFNNQFIIRNYLKLDN